MATAHRHRGLAPVTLRNVLAYIDAHLAYPITLNDLASEAALSEFHFARMFRQSMNMAPHQYVMQRRMALATASGLLHFTQFVRYCDDLRIQFALILVTGLNR